MYLEYPDKNESFGKTLLLDRKKDIRKMKTYSEKTKQTNTSTNRHTNVQNSYAFQKTER